MGTQIIQITIAAAAFIIFFLALWLLRKPDPNKHNQRMLDLYLNESMSPLEIGKLYERYVGHLYEIQGCRVDYHGALNGYSDLGRDLIIRNGRKTYIVQTKCWAKHKTINENHVFQLYGSLEHYRLTESNNNDSIEALLFTTAKFSEKAQEIAKVLGVELITLNLDKSYPLIKCNVSLSGEKIYHLPFDPYYDKIKINTDRGDCFVRTVNEAVEKGFRRARNHKNAA